MVKGLTHIPYLGVGIGLKKELVNNTLSYQKEIEVLEVITEEIMRGVFPAMILKEYYLPKFPIILHGVGLSIGSAVALEKPYLERIRNLCAHLKVPYYSEHLAITKLPGFHFGDLVPIWFTKEVLDLIVQKVNGIQNFLGIPLVLENITSDFDIPEADFEESEFITQLCEKTNCGLLLDVTNVYINYQNRKQDPYVFLRNIPLERIVEIHLAGGTIKDGWFYDTHSEKIHKEIWPLFEWVMARSHPKTVIIEREDNLEKDFKTSVLEDLQKIRSSMNRQSNSM